ncbi:glycosyltransferase family 4 protein [Alkalibacter saccharofermentans]|uniref:Glycosyltransferase involved in cell wall bisynthesis n=1 Tax=Alkalibacter saccharofermentans DSM 14828 TaxID=1120975 RepID=A0A1M4ZWK5_9FIRM|nr:glycosyltransferase family 4 protein [Alkalibacter saccharofermentans]SHF21996.1 Glycosyltransferase involved in cell wall bisynthesis [Alkalibacter saccharofermentans DSM 14828]
MKILYVTTISNTVNAFLIPHIKMLIDEGHQVDVAFNIEQEVKHEIYEMGCKIHQLPLQRSPIKRENFRAYKMLKDIIISEGYDLVHTHTPVASAIVRLACRKLSSVKVLYTAHGFHFFKGAPIRNWFIYYPIEKWLAKYTDTLITINKEDCERAKSQFKAKRVEYIPGVGIDIDKFNKVEIDRYLKRKELGLPTDAFVVLSVGELNKNKNHEVIIKAISKIGNPHIHYVICGEGQLDGYLRNLSKQLGIEKRVHLLGFRKDIAEICKASDVFAFPSLREGLGMAALEAMACGLPIITSNVHGIVDYSKNRVTGYSCKPNDIEDFTNAIHSILQNYKFIEEFRTHNLDAVKKFDKQNVETKLSKIYEEGL